jgi:hypothetical protein
MQKPCPACCATTKPCFTPSPLSPPAAGRRHILSARRKLNLPSRPSFSLLRSHTSIRRHIIPSPSPIFAVLDGPRSRQVPPPCESPPSLLLWQCPFPEFCTDISTSGDVPSDLSRLATPCARSSITKPYPPAIHPPRRPTPLAFPVYTSRHCASSVLRVPSPQSRGPRAPPEAANHVPPPPPIPLIGPVRVTPLGTAAAP